MNDICEAIAIILVWIAATILLPATVVAVAAILFFVFAVGVTLCLCAAPVALAVWGGWSVYKRFS
jgi:hypothetical protein